MINYPRREVLKTAVGLSLACTFPALVQAKSATTNEPSKDTTLASDEAYWKKIASYYDMTNKITNLENGNWGVMSQPVLEAYIEHTKRVNKENSYYARRLFGARYREIAQMMAERFGAQPDEIAFTRNATESLQTLIGGFNGLKAGDAVMFADLDYDSMQLAMRHAAKRHGCETIELAIPEPVTYEGLIAFYREALKRYPKTRLLLLTHMSHRTGLVIPVKQIVQIAREYGVTVIVDAAHSWGQIDFKISDLGADYVGLNLHKWMGAPLGVGAMYIRRGMLDHIDINMSTGEQEANLIYGRVHTGTINYAALMSVPDAFAFHDFVGAKRIETRLRYLRSVWIDELHKSANVQILTPEDSRLHGGITSFRIDGQKSVEANRQIAKKLLDRYGIFTVHRNGITAGACVRITPAIYNLKVDLIQTGKAVHDLATEYA